MKLIRSIFLSSFLLTVIFITGCNEGPTTSIDPNSSGVQLSKFSLPLGATLTSATLYIYMQPGNDDSVYIYGISSDWDEMTVTWNTKPSMFPIIEASFKADAITGWKTVDITGLVGKWLDGTYTNYGLLLDQKELDATVAHYVSKEGSAYQPYLKVEYTGGSEDVPDIADASIWELYPDLAEGNATELFTGYIQNKEKKSLLKFDIEPTPPSGGCTLTPGYWKTHSEFGPAPYDNTWALLPNGASTVFFPSKNGTDGPNYYQVLWTPPKGNAYYNLSFQYIAAGLNKLHGASVPAEVQAAYQTATGLFELWTPAQIGVLKGSNTLRQQFITLAGILGNYNSGKTGPGHCDDIESL